MIRVELTLDEVQRLQQCVADALLTQTQVELQAIWAKLVEAEARTTHQTQCPVCQHWFIQNKTGRTGQYCSAACKQKAYRQRRTAWSKQFGPSQQR